MTKNEALFELYKAELSTPGWTAKQCLSAAREALDVFEAEVCPAGELSPSREHPPMGRLLGELPDAGAYSPSVAVGAYSAPRKAEEIPGYEEPKAPSGKPEPAPVKPKRKRSRKKSAKGAPK